MFESDDWDLDQEFLNDIDDKAVKFYSQSDNHETEPKRRKIEICNNSVFSSDTNVDLYDKKDASKKIMKSDGSKESRRHLILGMFNKNLPDESIFQTTCDSQKSCNDTQNCEDNQLPRKNLILGILQKKNVHEKIIENNITNTSLSRVEATKIQSNNNINANQGSNMLNANRIRYQTSKSNYQKENNLNNNNSKLNSINNSRQELLCNIMKQKSVNNLRPNNDIMKNTLLITKNSQDQVEPNKKMTLVRKFPGPAGLLPDDISINVPTVSYLNSLEENEKANEESNSNKLPDYCSQNTKSLFTEGAWQLMLNDLPHDFLKGYEIATVKQMASTKGCSSTKVKFMAGIVEHIDHSHENPPILLRDFTDKIRGIIHRDIPLKYPGLLEPNVVVLLHDVGLLKISSTFVSNKYQILISPSSLLGIYTSKGEIERTHHMAAVFENISSKETGEKQKENKDHGFSKPSEAHSSKIDFHFKLKHSDNIQDSINSKKSTEDIKNKSGDTNGTVRVATESMDFDVDSFFSVSSSEITNSQHQKNFTGSVLKKQTNEGSKQQKSEPFVEKQKESIHNDEKERAENLLKALKRFSPNVNAKKRLPRHSKDSQLDAEHPVSTKQVMKQKVLSDTFSKQTGIDDCDVNISQQRILPSPSCKKIESVQLNSTLQRGKISIRSKLLQFKNPETLTPPSEELQKMVCLKENDGTPTKKESSESSSFFNDVLCSTENDSDDEMLSQLDIDTIFSNYN